MRRRMLWIALVVSAGFFLVTLLLAATGALTTGWYLVGAAVYGAVFVLAVIGFLTESVPPAASVAVFQAPTPALVLEAAIPTPPPRTERVEERVLYSTPRGHVVETMRATNGHANYAFTIETEGRTTTLDEVEQALETRGLEPGRAPGDEELRAALRRWGRIREVS